MIRMSDIELIICENCDLYSFLREKRNCVICGQFMCKRTYTKDDLINFGFECSHCGVQFDYDDYYKPVFYNNGKTQAVICESCWERKEPLLLRL